MKPVKHIFKTLLWSLPVLAAGTAANADDTEVFFNTPNTSIQPNILFILDNSGSMDTNVTTQSTYDSATTYTGSWSDSYIYFADSNRYVRSIPKTSNHCDDILGRLSSLGYVPNYQMARWYSRRNDWRSLRDENTTTDVECYNDRGVHGENSASSDKYIRDHRNQWGASNREASWSNIAYRDFYSANYLNWYFNHRTSVTQTRLEIVQQVSRNLANSMSGVNVGLMAFNTDGGMEEGGHLLLPIGDIDTNRNAFINQVDAMTPRTWTPLSETLFEALHYYTGKRTFLDDNPIASAMNGSNYASPIQSECQSNNIILLTDGEPTRDGNHKDTMASTVGSCDGNCLDEIADYMANNDVYPGFTGNQHINTYTVGFDLENDLLKDTATKGEGNFYLAKDAETLQDAFNAIVRRVLTTSTTFVAPGIAVNTFNRLNHLDALYFSVFQPELEPNWQGNLKRYRLATYTDNDGEKQAFIADVDGNPAVDDSSGFFTRGSRSWWSPSDDGPQVSEGGAASQHPALNSNRKVYTYYSGSGSTTLRNAANSVAVSNKANLTKTMFGDSAMSDAEHEALINWTRGADVYDEDRDGNTTESRNFISDPLHSKPHLLIYGGTEDNPDVAIFFGDNQGFIHAIDGSTGETHFSFIPAELLDNQRTLATNSADSARPYGMDGSIASWQYDHDGDGTIGTGDHVYIYGGMRRGGSSYYALDVTDLSDPSVLFTIHGGSGDFAELGQTWSKPVKTTVKIGNSNKEVLIFSGGYDVGQDGYTVRTADTIGRAIYMVDATTGARLWWAGPSGSGADAVFSEMLYSMPATPKVLDTNGDGFADQMYIGDMGGQVWRFDINNGERTSSLVSGAVIGNFSGSTEAENRRFYNTPDLFGFDYGNKRYLGLVIGSGWRAHPLNTAVEDRIYMLRIRDAGTSPDSDADGTTDYDNYGWTEDDLYDATANLIGQGTNTEVQTATNTLSQKNGWYMKLVDYSDGQFKGEKVLSASTTVNNQVFFTTYEPTPVTDGCVPRAGKSRLYHIWAKDAQPVLNYDKTVSNSETDLTKEDRRVELTDPLPPDPQRMRVDGVDVICVGAKCTKQDTVTGLIETFWYQAEE